jgi:succinate-semialdehyde dehydrogenase/glutarate-semialdehyde dehydrogenase
VVVGGARHDLGGTFFQPTVLTGLDASMLITREETFGPVAAIYRFHDEADVVRRANDTPYGLAAYFYARDLGRVMRVAEGLQSGMVGVNTAALGVDCAPFGGVKESGLGREGSSHGLDEFVELKYVLLGGL